MGVPPTNGQALIYDSADSQWKPQTLVSPSTALSSLTDVQIGSLANGELLTYNTTASKWINQTKPDYAIEEMKDYKTGSAKIDSDVMSWDGIALKWQPKTLEQE